MIVPFLIRRDPGIGGAVFAPTERRPIALASAWRSGFAECGATFRRLLVAQAVVAGLMLVAIFLMVTKLGS